MSHLMIHDTLSKKKRLFEPLSGKKVNMYVCGMTVYDYCHLGHARVMITFDMIVRYMRSQGYDVTFVQNITDIDDKIINKAIKENKTWQSLTAYYIDQMHQDAKALNIQPPDLQPKASEHIDGMIQMMQSLQAKELAYVTDNGDLCYSVSSFKSYGALSGRKLSDLRAGARVDINESKRDPLDFVLWKKAKPNEPSWPSPWGDGRPGWHIECSAMAHEMLGKTIDIHGGGFDLQFPHHENEIAQSEGSHDRCFARYWMHVGFLNIDKEKMSKSLGNFLTIREALKDHHPEALRLFMLQSHYKSPCQYDEKTLQQASLSLRRWYLCLDGLQESQSQTAWPSFVDAMNDDFNTPKALASLAELVTTINALKAKNQLDKAASYASTLKAQANILGLLYEDSQTFLQGKLSETKRQWIEEQISKRQQARKEKNWALADQCRDALLAKGIELEDGDDGITHWHKA
jgi:cysteinyl-tRNA synthetase